MDNKTKYILNRYFGARTLSVKVNFKTKNITIWFSDEPLQERIISFEFILENVQNFRSECIPELVHFHELLTALNDLEKNKRQVF